MALKCIVFDCDGIIIESVAIKTHAFSRLAEPYGPEAQRRLVEYHALYGGVSRFEKFIWFSQEVLGQKLLPQVEQDWARKFIQYCDEGLETCPLVPGFQEVLDDWHGRLPLYVASGAPHEELNALLQRRRLAPKFAGIYGTPPPKADLVQRAVSHAGVAPHEAIMIGDSSTDLDAATRVGTLFYGRGRYFADSGHPWHDDLTRLSRHLETLA